MKNSELKAQIQAVIGMCNHPVDAGAIKATLFLILADMEASEIPKPNEEQLAALGKALDGDAPRRCEHLDIIWNGTFAVCASEGMKGTFRWHLKDAPAPQPAQMICERAEECADSTCGRKIKHDKMPACDKPALRVCPFPTAVCVPWAEKVELLMRAFMSTCAGCKSEFLDGDCFEGCTGYAKSATSALFPRHNYVAKQPEPAAPVMAMRQEIETVLAYLHTTPPVEFRRENLAAFCESVLERKG